MSGAADTTIHDLLVFGLTALLVGYALWALVSALRRSRPALVIGFPILLALVIRVLAAAGTSLSGIGDSLRGPDELGFLAESRSIADGVAGLPSLGDVLVRQLHEFVLAIQLAAFDSPELALRLTQAGIAVAGIALLVTAVYELAGARAAVLSAWLLAIEPTNIFFTTLMHKESNMMLASGLVAFGGARMWKRADLRPLLPMTIGCLIAVATRPYAGWFLIAATAAITLHAGLRAEQRGSLRSLSLISIVLLVAALAAPTVFEASTEENLERLQGSQEANVSDTSNLGLESVDFSTREAIIVNLPIRIRDVVFRPLPWQLENPAQQLGVIGTLIALVLLGVLLRLAWLSRGQIMARAGPLVYTAFLLLIAYSLSAGNAGTAFRYRMHVVAVAICIAVVLREWFHHEASDAEQLLPDRSGMPAVGGLRREPGAV